MSSQQEEPWHKRRYKKLLQEETFYNTGISKRRYDSLHNSIRWKFGKASFCIWDSTHESKRFEWANVSGVHSKELEDYLPMCVRCHRRFDLIDDRGTSKNPLAKLTVNQVINIRHIGRAVSQAEIGRLYGLNKRYVGQILRRERWDI